MKTDYLILAVLIIGLAALFFFPSPESNFLLYAGTALFFGILIGVLLVLRRKKK